MEAHEVSAAHFLAENDMSTMKSPAGTPVKGANVMVSSFCTPLPLAVLHSDRLQRRGRWGTGDDAKSSACVCVRVCVCVCVPELTDDSHLHPSSRGRRPSPQQGKAGRDSLGTMAH
jgi:hypothetical protein